MKTKTKVKKQNQKQKFNISFFILPRHLQAILFHNYSNSE